MAHLILTPDEQERIMKERSQAEAKAKANNDRITSKRRKEQVLVELRKRRLELEQRHLRIPLEIIERFCKEQKINDLEAHELMNEVYGVLPLTRHLRRLVSRFQNLSQALERVNDEGLRQVALSQKMAREQSEKEAAQESRQNQEMLRDKERRENTYCAACRSTPCRCSMTD